MIEIGCCGAYCRTCREYLTTCKGCANGYAEGSRQLARARCRIKKCCIPKNYASCAECDALDDCAIIQSFYQKGYKYRRYQSSVAFIRAHGYEAFAQAAAAWTKAYGKLPPEA